MRAEVAGRIDLTATASGENHTGRRGGWSLWTSVHALIAHLTFWLVSIPCKRFRFPFDSSPFRHGWCGWATAPKPTG